MISTISMHSKSKLVSEKRHSLRKNRPGEMSSRMSICRKQEFHKKDMRDLFMKESRKETRMRL